jgi:TolB-like protein/Flp pilus assembly protein TadD
MAGPYFLFGPFTFDAERARLSRDGRRLDVGQRALGVLHALLNANGHVVTKAQLMDLAWPGAVVEESNLSVQIAALRKLLGPTPAGGDWIATVARIGYRFAEPVTVAGAAEESTAESTAVRPSVAVLPFDNLSGEEDKEYFVDGITEDIIAALSRFRWFFVIARNAAFTFKHRTPEDVAQALAVRYVLAGSVRRSGNRIRISAELVDARSATTLWADRYDFEFGELFSVQDRITEQVVGAIEPELLKSESVLAIGRRRGVRDMTGWDLVHQGTWFFHQITRPTHLRARELFREARKADSQLAEAHAWIGRVSAGIVAYGWSEDEAADLREGIDAALKAVQLDEKNPYSHYALAITSVFASEFDQAIRAADKAVELSPGFALGHLVLGMARLYSGDALRAVRCLERGLQLNPHDPQNFVWYNILATALLLQHEFDSAVQQATNALKVRPKWRPAITTALCCYQAMGQKDRARECVERLSQCEPSADALGPLWRTNARWRDEMTSLLGQAGWRPT